MRIKRVIEILIAVVAMIIFAYSLGLSISDSIKEREMLEPFSKQMIVRALAFGFYVFLSLTGIEFFAEIFFNFFKKQSNGN